MNVSFSPVAPAMANGLLSIPFPARPTRKCPSSPAVEYVGAELTDPLVLVTVSPVYFQS